MLITIKTIFTCRASHLHRFFLFLFLVLIASFASAVTLRSDAYADDRPHNFTFVNTFTIAATCDGGPCYWILGNDSADLGAIDKVDELVFVRNNIPDSANLCNDVITYDTHNNWGRIIVQDMSDACADPEPVVTLAISNVEKLFKYWYTDTDGTLRSVSGAGSTWLRVSGDKMADGGITGLKELYVQQSGSDGCPDMILGYSGGRWGYIAPQKAADGKATRDPVHDYYRKMVDATGLSSDTMGACDAGAYMRDEDWSLNSLASNTSRSRDFFDDKSILGDSSGPSNGWTTFNILSDVYWFSTQPLGTMKEVMVLDAEGMPVSPPEISGTTSDVDGTTTCLVEGLGWIICPVANLMANIADEAKDQVDGMMTVGTTEVFASDGAAKVAWGLMRSIANVLFIIAFLIVIYSQLTSAGISNYGIKKMIPRLIMAAVLINISWYVSVAAIEVSNVVGLSATGLLSGLTDGGMVIPAPNSDSGLDTGAGFAGWVGAALVLGVGGYFFLGAVLSVLVYALFMILTMVLLLGLRQALLILLVVLSPIAFTANLLPNTEGLFKKWWNLFKLLLIAFPIVGLMYGIGIIAKDVLMSEDNDWKIQIFGIVALFAWIFVLKKTLETATAVGGVGSMVGNLTNKGQGFIGGKAEDRLKRTAFMRGKEIRKQAKENYRNEKFADAMTSKGRRGFLRRQAAQGVTPLTSKFSKSAEKQRDYISRAAYNTANKADTDEVNFGAQQATSAAIAKSAGGKVDAKDVLAEGLRNAMKNHDSVATRAHIQALEAMGEQGVTRIRDEIEDAQTGKLFDGNKGESLKGDVMKHVNANSSLYKAKDVRLDRWKNTGKLTDLQNADYTGLDDEQISTQTRESLSSALRSGNIDAVAARRILSNNDVAKNIKGAKREGFEELERTGSTTKW